MLQILLNCDSILHSNKDWKCQSSDVPLEYAVIEVSVRWGERERINLFLNM